MIRVTAAPLTAPATSGTSDDDLSHAVCCDPNTTMCGLDASGFDWTAGLTGPVCPVCEIAALNALPCGNPNCPDRK